MNKMKIMAMALLAVSFVGPISVRADMGTMLSSVLFASEVPEVSDVTMVQDGPTSAHDRGRQAVLPARILRRRAFAGADP